MSSKPINRWLVLFSSVVINLCIGSAYAWSVFQKPLIDLFHWSTSATSLVFTLSLSVVPIAMIVAGKIQDMIGPKKVIFVGGAFFGVGVAGAGFSNTLNMLYLTYGVLGGIGIGSIYACTVANTVKFFPDRRGLASGLVAAGFGSGAVLFAPLSTTLIDAFGVLTAFKLLGLGHLLAIWAFALFIKPAPEGFTPAGWIASKGPSHAVATVEKDWRRMLCDPKFYLLWFIYTAGTVSGLMITAHASPFAQEVIKTTPKAAAVAVGLLALANTGGRIFWGWISDRIGRYSTVVAMFVFAGAAMLAMPHISEFVGFVVVLMAVGLCFGGFMGIYPSITADVFGAKHLGVNYGVMFTAFGAAAILGPRLAAKVKETNGGDYSQAFWMAAVMCLVGVILTLVLIFGRTKQPQQEEACVSNDSIAP